MWLNILFLIFAALVPFSAKVMSENNILLATTNSEMNAAYGFFTVTTIASILTLLAMWKYATRGYHLVDTDIDPRIIPTISRIILVGTAVNVLGVVLSTLIPWAGYIGFIAMVYMIFMTARGKFVFGSVSANLRKKS